MNIQAVKLVFFSAGMLLCLSLAAQLPMEEFNGPFSSWVNVKLRYGAKGNGRDNDTRAIQKAIDDLGMNSPGTPLFTVLYLPAGTYCISSTLVLKGKLGIAIIGENPSNTSIKWTGPDGGTMLWANGSAFFKICRLNWDAANHHEIEAIGIHWKDRWKDARTESHASVNIEISDNIFSGNCKYGISGGTNPGEGTGSNDSEIAIKRCLFQNCTGAGIFTTGYNALDYWVWDCRFINCNIGINSKFGNFFAYRSYFKGSVLADITNTNGYFKSMRGCFSEDSRGLAVDSGASYNPFKRVYQANTIMRPKWQPIQFYHQGRIFLLDNHLDKAIDTTVNAFVKTGSGVISFNNTYRSRQPVNFTNPNALQRSGDAYAAKLNNAAAAFLQTQAKTPVLVQRQVFDIPVGANDVVIQQIINAAARLKGKRPVVHFAAGRYMIARPLQVPASSDMQIIGDGCLNASIILPAPGFPDGEALLKIAGPALVTLKEIQLGNFTNSKSNIDAIRFNNADQPGSRAFIDQLYAAGNKTIMAEGLDYLYIQKDNSFFADNDMISGGSLTAAGKGSACLYGFGGQFAGINLQNNAKAVLKDCWWEGNMRNPVDIAGSGNLTIDGAMIAPAKADSSVTVSIKKFKGNISLMNAYLQGGVHVTPENPELKLLMMNIHFFYTLDPLKFLSRNALFKGLFTGLSVQCFTNDPKCAQIYFLPDAKSQVTDAEGFIADMLAEDRKALPQLYEIKNAAASNILLSRVSLGDINNAVRFSR